MGEAQRRKELGNYPGNGKGMRQDIDLATCEKLKCINPNCDSDQFYTAFELRKISAIMSNDGREHVIPMEFFYCNFCHTSTGILRKIG